METRTAKSGRRYTNAILLDVPLSSRVETGFENTNASSLIPHRLGLQLEGGQLIRGRLERSLYAATTREVLHFSEGLQQIEYIDNQGLVGLVSDNASLVLLAYFTCDRGTSAQKS